VHIWVIFKLRKIKEIQGVLASTKPYQAGPVHSRGLVRREHVA
jgi:hypothetical protein